MALNLFRRHRRHCHGGHEEDSCSSEFEERRPRWKRCDCPIHASGTLAGQYRRRCTDRATWEDALKWASAREATGRWDPEEGPAPPTQQQIPTPPTAPDSPTDGPPPRATITEVNLVYLAHRKAMVGHATFRKDRTFTKQLAAFGAARGYVFLDQFRTLDIDVFYAASTLGPRSKSKRLEILRRFFRFAVNRDLIPKSPVGTDLKPPAGASRPVNKMPFTDEQLADIIKACDQLEDKRWGNRFGTGVWTGEDVKDFIWVMAFTGLRISDVVLYDQSRRNDKRRSIRGLLAASGHPARLRDPSPDCAILGMGLGITSGKGTSAVIAFVGAAAVVITFAPALARAQVTSYAFVPRFDSDTLTVIDTSTDTALLPLLTMPDGPMATAATPDGSRFYAISVPARSVSVLDAVARTPLSPPVSLSGISPFAITVSPDGNKVYVGQTSHFSVLDVASNAVTGPIPLSATPLGLAITADGLRMFATNANGSNAHVIDLLTNTATPISLGSGTTSESVAITRDGQRVLMTCPSANKVAIIDAATLNVGFVTVGTRPEGIAITPDGQRAYVANGGSTSVSVIALATNTVIATIPMPGSPSGVAITPDGRKVYVSLRGRGVIVIDPVTNTVGPEITAASSGWYLSIGPNIIVPAATPLTVASDAELTTRGFGSFVNFNGGTLQLAGDLSSARTVSLLPNGGVIDTNGFTATLTGPLVNTGVLTKTGTGTLVLNSSNAGTPIVVAGGVLGGGGTVGTINATGGAIGPGDGEGDDVGTLHASHVTFQAGASLIVDLNGLTAGVQYDRLNVSGVAALNQATLVVKSGFTPPPGATFTIVSHARGRFAGLVDGSIVTAVGGAHFRISYAGGVDGDAVVLTADQAPGITAVGDQTVRENGVLGPVPFTVTDDHTSASALDVSATSSNPSLVPPSGIFLEQAGATRMLTVTPRAGASGQTTITLSVSDGAAITTTSFTLTVTPAPRYYLSEGATSGFFDTDILLANPNNAPAPVEVAFLKEDGMPVIETQMLPPMSRTTIRTRYISRLEAAAFSTVVTSIDSLPIVVERTMRWDASASGYGTHTEKASDGAATQWYFAEGSQGFFFTYFLLVNPQPTANVAHVTYLREGEPALVREYTLLPSSRVTIDAGNDPELVDRSFGAQITFDQPGMAERSMYFGLMPVWSGGSGAAGVTAPATSWFLAEGATGSYFSTFVLLANPNDATATATVTLLPATGSPVTTTHDIPGHQRITLNIAEQDASLASTAVATRVESTVPIVAERAQYWPNGNWHEAHTSAGVTSLGTTWGLAEGRVGGSGNEQTYILLANPGTSEADVSISFLRTSGAPIVKTFKVQPESRFNVAVAGPGSDVPELANESFGARITSTQPIAVERSMYSDANGVTWAAGSNATATRLPAVGS